MYVDPTYTVGLCIYYIFEFYVSLHMLQVKANVFSDVTKPKLMFSEATGPPSRCSFLILLVGVTKGSPQTRPERLELLCAE